MNLNKFKLKIVTKYILKEFIPTFIISFLFFFIIFVINHILYYIKPLFEKKLPFNLIFMMFVTAFPLFTILSLPFGTMLATLMTMGRLSSDNEIVAFRSLGFSIISIFGPIFISSIIIFLIAFIVWDQIYPISQKEQRITLRKIMQVKPTLNFKSKRIVKYFGKIIFTDIIEDTKIKGLFIIESEKQKKIISAKEAIISSPKNRKGSIELSMNKSMLQFNNSDRPNEFNFGYADSIKYYIAYQEIEGDEEKISISESTTLQLYKELKKYRKIYNNELKARKLEINLQKENVNSIKKRFDLYLKDYSMYISFINELDNEINNLKNMIKEKENRYKLNNYSLEFYNKFALPLACIIFAIFASPIGIYSKRAGFSIGFILGLFLCAFYWFSYYGLRVLGIRELVPPFIAIFGPNLLFLVVGIFFLIKRLKE